MTRLLLPLLLVLACLRTAGAAPNILFLFTDDQRADAIGALGNPVVKTPHMDSLVQRGFAFTRAFCLGSDQGAVCTPSRNMLLSGRAFFRWKGQRLAPADGSNLPALLGQAGYETWHYGKKHNTATAIQATFEHNHYLADDEAERLSGNPGAECADGAIRFLTTERDRKRPFFMYAAFGNPHDPRVANPEYKALYERDKIPVPQNYAPQHPFKTGAETCRDELLAPWPRTRAVVQEHLHDYYAVMTCLDGHIGRILATLREQGLEEDTIVILSSDHGLTLGSHGLMGKQTVYDDGYRAPLVFAGPGISHGTSDALCYLMDIMPTICDFAGAEKPSTLDALSLLPVLSGKQASMRDSLFLTYTDTQKAIRTAEWKLIRYPQVNVTQLFHVVEDPYEVFDLSKEPDQKERIASLTAALTALQAQFGDDAPLTVIHPQPAAFVPPTGADLEALKAAKPKKKAAPVKAD